MIQRSFEPYQISERVSTCYLTGSPITSDVTYDRANQRPSLLLLDFMCNFFAAANGHTTLDQTTQLSKPLLPIQQLDVYSQLKSYSKTNIY